jgi:hypothetical protein
MNDLNDLHGAFPTALRWNAENGFLGHRYWDDTTGARSIKEIELGSPAARFVLDLATRERGYGLIRKGVYDMRLTPVNSPPPPWPGDEDFKPAIGCWLWNPTLGEVRLETNGAIFRGAVAGIWERCWDHKEASDGLQPVIDFVDRREQSFEAIGRTFWAPIIALIGWCERNRVSSFALREPTVKPPAALDSQVKFALLNTPRPEPEPVRTRGKAKTAAAASKPDNLKDILDDDLPENLR